MAIALTIQEYLDDQHIPYTVMKHDRTENSSMTARQAHVSGNKIAKGVVLKWDGSYVLAVVPASRHVDLGQVRKLLGEKVDLASERETSRLFPDCDTGAVPIVAEPYRVACLIDEELDDCSDIYFEGGDHQTLVHVKRDDFSRLMYGMPHGQISM